MNATITNPKNMSFGDIMKLRKQMYVITLNNGKPEIEAMTFDNVTDESVVIFIAKEECDDYAKVQEELPDKELPPPVDKKRDKPRRMYERLTYKFDGWSSDGKCRVDSRPDGSIRVSFHEKDDALEYRDYFREQFYISNTGADALSVDSIYSDLKLVNPDGTPMYDYESCRKWGYVSQDHGTCKYISEVSKTIGLDMFGFTLKRPVKLYGMTKENAM